MFETECTPQDRICGLGQLFPGLMHLWAGYFKVACSLTQLGWEKSRKNPENPFGIGGVENACNL